MPQLHCYVPESLAQQAQHQANRLGLSVSAYLSELVKRDASLGWPTGYESALFGAARPAPLKLEPVGPAEERQAFE